MDPYNETLPVVDYDARDMHVNQLGLDPAPMNFAPL